ncbi:bifunctional 2-polyprenyl-6-hydroxyphenol methylase/3-demethylubiquinol 3-O-methyltransferase UbiG [Streptomyces sp. V3I7]|uniref:class I SAM-dependent methyltransferase n=1 Tax=Streptomyces sp. V3I7 TaxID=3042278 RepID=UPI0027836815|nr:class I SAM-dependent methyltransferase [Streptomyces sp. V3I7]MDQ0993867.1 SAM-dependent methyltransferase [Streptomyces sp. V3I7]
MSGETALATDYASGALSKNSEGELERLRLLQEWGDPDTREVLRTAGLDRAARCLEIGAGAGSVARWIADACPDGSVVAVDIDTRYVRDIERPHLQWRTGDVRELDFAPGSFDLIHSRLTFCHLPEREELVARAVRWLRPGGRLVLGDPMCMPAAGSVHAPVRRFFGALEEGWAAQGSDMTRWAQTLPSQLARAGLTGIGVLTRANCLGGTGPYAALAAANIRQEGAYLVRTGLLAQAEVDAVADLCADPGFTDIRSITVYAWGRVPTDGSGARAPEERS